VTDNGITMKRLSMRICTLVCISLSLLCVSCGTGKGSSHLKVNEVTQDIGLDEPMDIVFLADTHISLCDDRDSDLKDKAALRYQSFVSPDGIKADEMFAEEMAYVSKLKPDLLILGGDIIDSAMYASIDFVDKSLKDTNVPYIYGMGNHDFEYGDEYYSDRAYSEYLPRLSAVSDTSDGYQIKEYDKCVIFVADDENNQISSGALDKLKELSEQDKPVILCTHVPIEPDEEYGSELIDKSIEAWGATDDGRSRVLLGDHACIPNDITRQFIDIVKDPEGPVVLVMSGHIHFSNESKLNSHVSQIVTGAGFEGDLIHLTIR